MNTLFNRIHNAACLVLYKDADTTFWEGLKSLQDKFGGVLWASGGNTPLLSILQGDHCICVSEDYLCEYRMRPHEAVSYKKLMYIDDDAVQCTQSKPINGEFFYRKECMQFLRTNLEDWLSGLSTADVEIFKNLEIAFFNTETQEVQTEQYFRE